MDYEVFSLDVSKGNQVSQMYGICISLFVSIVHILLFSLPPHLNELVNTFPMDFAQTWYSDSCPSIEKL